MTSLKLRSWKRARGWVDCPYCDDSDPMTTGIPGGGNPLTPPEGFSGPPSVAGSIFDLAGGIGEGLLGY